ncbi:4-hydroxy-tetrahydrodipicolinate synthase [Bifidobacterium gallicum]|uniref:4-hydroxy-tetrahydrodipicolinate synthase n=1 Tax=Bifidobacterium gallicum DSM 20093 = LMG 11596 TaxID=561180 RepID=D1NTB9_9BIFI|nr:4-hydroxy-tetrahydrodipicolinate synthase [Bifidobacterium gallicum]EFA22973.1 dihydrodipicolinate synthase [Bifidobacterium gallicum DSM 20093 = LMG 11596]KFI57704.1 dihydrodipicolinate synthase [Bifidobacterium gallicum DSM 20093 = LMG 11596]
MTDGISTTGTPTQGADGASIHLLDPAPFGRVLPAMVTPMTPNGDVDFEAAQRVAKQLVADGADGIVVNGTTGESPTTHMDEKVELVKAVKSAVDVPVISGAGSNDTAHTVRMVEQTQEAGADAVLVVCPYYSRPSQEGIFQHYSAVEASADKPIIIYDVPGRTGVRIQHDTYCRLAELDHVTAVKDATGDIAGAVRKRLDTGLTWYSGDDALYLPFLSIGAVGIISVVAHAAAGPMRDLAAAFDRGDIAQAQQLAWRIAPAVEAMNGAGFQAGMAKAALYARGLIDCTMMRLPNVGPTPEQIQHVTDGLKNSGLL